MRRILFYLFAFHLCVVSFAQFSQEEIGLKDGQKLYPAFFKLNQPLFGKRHLLVNDSIKINLSEVDYYKTSANFFLVRSIGLASNEPLMRVEAGDISVYKYETVNHNHSMMMGPNGMMNPVYSAPQKKTVYYYQMGNRNFQKVNIKNLKTDLMDHRLSMSKVKRASNQRLVRIGLWVAGGAFLLAGIHQMSIEAVDRDFGGRGVNLSLILGVGMISAPFFIKNSEQENLLDAIRVYNAEKRETW